VNEKELNIKEKIYMLEGKHHRYPKGCAKKIKIDQLTDRQKLLILIHYNNIFSKSDFKSLKYYSDIYE
jgi:hypothetical protein|tara:strand:- start:466 stop:669 length:204 start_codon:yes stop_codon:yes gene_type:complete